MVESYEPEPPCTMVDPTCLTLAGEARRSSWCEHELMYHIFEFGVPEGLRSMEAHMKALASVDEGSETVVRGRRILELATEEDEANSVVFPGGVLQEEDTSVMAMFYLGQFYLGQVLLRPILLRPGST